MYQRWYADAASGLTQARAGLRQAAEQFHECTTRAAAGGAPFSFNEDLEISRIAVGAQLLSWEVMQNLMRTAGSSAAVAGPGR